MLLLKDLKKAVSRAGCAFVVGFLVSYAFGLKHGNPLRHTSSFNSFLLLDFSSGSLDSLFCNDCRLVLGASVACVFFSFADFGASPDFGALKLPDNRVLLVLEARVSDGTRASPVVSEGARLNPGGPGAAFAFCDKSITEGALAIVSAAGRLVIASIFLCVQHLPIIRSAGSSSDGPSAASAQIRGCESTRLDQHNNTQHAAHPHSDIKFSV